MTSIDLPPSGGRTHEERVATFLEFACWDHHVHGKGDHRMYDRAAGRILAQHPDIARDSLYTAVVCGDLADVERRLGERPESANESGGARKWPPLVYLCYARFTHAPLIENALAIANALLDRGADPNAFYDAGVPYTALVGVAGEGEQDSPRQPYAEALFKLLLERGAKPFDIQVLYNTHFSGDVLWWLKLVHAHTMTTPERTAWDDPGWRMFDMGGYGPGAIYFLSIAIEQNDLELARWVLSHGASPILPSGNLHHKFKPTHTLYEVAVAEHRAEIAELLLKYGATRSVPALTGEHVLLDACGRGDREAAGKIVAEHPEYLQSTKAIVAAARRDREDIVAMLLDLGVPLELSDANNTRTLHQAAVKNARRVAELLVTRGAEIDPRETRHGATPIGWAAHADHTEMIDYLSRFSRSVWTLAFRGYPARLREVLRENPDLAKQKDSDGITPLWWLPDDEAKALEIVDLLVAHGADPAAKNKNGRTAVDWALKRGMRDVATRLVSHG